MATRQGDIPMVDRIRAQEEAAGVSLSQAQRMADEGDDFELAMMRSGVYGEDQSEQAGQEIDAEMALRSLGDLIIRLREAAVERRWGVDEQTLLNFAFRSGHHYVEVDRSRRAVVAIPAPRDAVRRKVHKFEPWYRSQHSRLSGGDPSYQTQPATNQQEDRDAAEMAEKLIEWDAVRVHSHENKAETAMWQLLAGSCVAVSTVSFEEDPEYLQVPTGQIDPMTQQQVLETMPKPVLDFEILPPQLVWADDRQDSIEKMRWLGIDRATTMAEAIAAYPDAVELLKPQIGGTDDRGLNVTRRTQRMTATEDPFREASQAETGAVAGVDEEEEVLLLEFRLAPGAALQGPMLDRLGATGIPYELHTDPESGVEPVCSFPEGLTVILTTEGRILDISPLLEGFIAAQEIKFSQSSGFWANAPATFLREINQAMNWAFSLWEEHLLRTGRPREMWPRQARVRRRGSMNKYQRLEYRASQSGAKPEYMKPPPMAADSIRFFERLDLLWQDISGLHEVSQAKLPSSDISGVAISLLQEQDLAQLGFAGSEMESAFTNIIRQRLKLIQKFYPRNDPRLVKLAGDQQYILHAFMQADLEDALDVGVVTGSVIPRSPAAVKAEAIEAWQLGVLVDEFGRPDSRRMKQILQFGNYEDLYEEDEANKSNARQVEDMILSLAPEEAMILYQIVQETGQLPAPLMPQPEDDHMIFERSHRLRLVRSRQDPRVTPLHQALLRVKWSVHLQAIAPLLMQTDPSVPLGASVGLLSGGEEGAGQGDAQGGDSGTTAETAA